MRCCSLESTRARRTTTRSCSCREAGACCARDRHRESLQEIHLYGRGGPPQRLAMPRSQRCIAGRCTQVALSPASLQASRGSLKGWTSLAEPWRGCWRAETGHVGRGWGVDVAWSSLVWSSSRVIRKRFTLPSVIQHAIWCNFGGSEGALLCLLHPGRRLTTYSPTGAPTPTTHLRTLPSLIVTRRLHTHAASAVTHRRRQSGRQRHLPRRCIDTLVHSASRRSVSCCCDGHASLERSASPRALAASVYC